MPEEEINNDSLKKLRGDLLLAKENALNIDSYNYNSVHAVVQGEGEDATFHPNYNHPQFTHFAQKTQRYVTQINVLVDNIDRALNMDPNNRSEQNEKILFLAQNLLTLDPKTHNTPLYEEYMTAMQSYSPESAQQIIATPTLPDPLLENLKALGVTPTPPATAQTLPVANPESPQRNFQFKISTPKLSDLKELKTRINSGLGRVASYLPSETAMTDRLKSLEKFFPDNKKITSLLNKIKTFLPNKEEIQQKLDQIQNMVPNKEQITPLLNQIQNMVPNKEQITPLLNRIQNMVPNKEQITPLLNRIQNMLPSKEQITPLLNQIQDRLPKKDEITQKLNQVRNLLPNSKIDIPNQQAEALAGVVNFIFNYKGFRNDQFGGNQPISYEMMRASEKLQSILEKKSADPTEFLAALNVVHEEIKGLSANDPHLAQNAQFYDNNMRGRGSSDHFKLSELPKIEAQIQNLANFALGQPATPAPPMSQTTAPETTTPPPLPTPPAARSTPEPNRATPISPPPTSPSDTAPPSYEDAIRGEALPELPSYETAIAEQPAPVLTGEARVNQLLAENHEAANRASSQDPTSLISDEGASQTANENRTEAALGRVSTTPSNNPATQTGEMPGSSPFQTQQNLSTLNSTPEPDEAPAHSRGITPGQ